MAVELTTRVLNADRDAIAAAARVLAEGGLVAFPTETVYGLGADATNGEAVARLYAAKGRPRFNPLIAHVTERRGGASRSRASRCGRRSSPSAFWPGPLTLVLPKADGCPVSELATAGLDSIAVRVPAHPVARDLLKAFGKPVVAPSANQSGHVSPTTAAARARRPRRPHRSHRRRRRRPASASSRPSCRASTCRRCCGRAGCRARTIERVLGHALLDLEQPMSDEAPLAPGMLASHYAPRTPLRLNARDVQAGEALLAFGARCADGAAHVLNLSPTGDLVEAAANLFSHLRALDASGASGIAVMPIPNEGLGEAINDRLARAAAPR